MDLSKLNDKEAVDYFLQQQNLLTKEISKVIIGQKDTVKEVMMSIFCRSHCLLVGVPGLAKTLLVKTISESLGLEYSRIQFTPDLMPSDITGAEILDENKHFKFIKGPLFANLILADEINRTPPKTQSALLESMQEYAVTISGKRYEVPKPFFVLATQNPIEQEGTYPLPEAQLDRFMFSLWLDYPNYEDEVQIVKNTTTSFESTVNKVLDAESIMYFQNLVRKVPIAENVIEYAVRLSTNTRVSSTTSDVVKKYVSWGAGPRASQFLVLGAKCHAIFSGKYSPDIEDVRAVAIPVLRHRVIRNYKAEADGFSIEKIIKSLF